MSNRRSAATLVNWPETDSRNRGERGRLRCAVIRTRHVVISRLVLPLRHSRCRTTAWQSRRTGSPGEQHLGARGGPARGVPLRECWPVVRRGSGHAGRPAVRRTQPECPLRQALRTGTTSSGTDNPLAAASSVTGSRRRGYGWRPVRPDRAFRASGASPILPDASREALIDEVARPDSVTTMPSFSKPLENSTSRNGLPSTCSIVCCRRGPQCSHPNG